MARAGRKFARSMTADELKACRLELRLDMTRMAISLGWPYRTYQDREYGKRGIGPVDAEHVRETVKKEKRKWSKFLKEMRARIMEDVRRDYPNGIPSEITEEESEYSEN